MTNLPLPRGEIIRTSLRCPAGVRPSSLLYLSPGYAASCLGRSWLSVYSTPKEFVNLKRQTFSNFSGRRRCFSSIDFTWCSPPLVKSDTIYSQISNSSNIAISKSIHNDFYHFNNSYVSQMKTCVKYHTLSFSPISSYPLQSSRKE